MDHHGIAGTSLRLFRPTAVIALSSLDSFPRSWNPRSLFFCCLLPLKLIIAIIQPGKLEAVKESLSQVEVVRLTVLDCQGFGRQKGPANTAGQRKAGMNLLPKLQLQIAVNEEFVAPTVAAITEGGRSGESGEMGDGKIFVLPMDDCIRIRTGQRGQDAI